MRLVIQPCTKNSTLHQPIIRNYRLDWFISSCSESNPAYYFYICLSFLTFFYSYSEKKKKKQIISQDSTVSINLFRYISSFWRSLYHFENSVFFYSNDLNSHSSTDFLNLLLFRIHFYCFSSISSPSSVLFLLIVFSLAKIIPSMIAPQILFQ